MEASKYSSRDLNDFDIIINRDQYHIRVFWARIVGSDRKSLLTDYTKHTFFESEIVLNGSTDFLLGTRERVRVSSSGFIVIPPDTFHQVIESSENGARLIIAFSLETHDRQLDKVISSLSELRPMECSAAMMALLDILISKPYEDDTVTRALFSSVLESFLLEIFDIAKHNHIVSSAAASEDLKALYAVISYIREKHGVGVSVKSLSEHFSVSQRHLCRLFREQTGRNVRDTLNHEKLTRIEELVTSTKLSLYEIAELCGFCDEYAMNKFFRRYNLINLSDFRRLQNNEHPAGRRRAAHTANKPREK